MNFWAIYGLVASVTTPRMARSGSKRYLVFSFESLHQFIPLVYQMLVQKATLRRLSLLFNSDVPERAIPPVFVSATRANICDSVPLCSPSSAVNRFWGWGSLDHLESGDLKNIAKSGRMGDILGFLILTWRECEREGRERNIPVIYYLLLFIIPVHCSLQKQDTQKSENHTGGPFLSAWGIPSLLFCCSFTSTDNT